MQVNWERCVRVAVCAAAVSTMCVGGATAQDTEKQQSFRTFYLKNATSQNAASDISRARRNMVPRARIYYAETASALMVGGTPDELGQAQKILTDLDRPHHVYRVTYTISDGRGASRHLSMLVSRGRRAMTRQGSRVPIMTGSYNTESRDPSNTQYQYVDIGLSVDAAIEGYGDGERLISKIELTAVSDQKSNVGIQDPIVDQSVLEAQSAINSAKPVRLGSLDMPDGRHTDIEVAIETVQ